MKLQTDRLSILPISTDHAPFMFYLMNSPEWKKFIGDRSIHSVDDALNYVQKILRSVNTNYWIIQRKEDGKLVGVVSFLKRDYLEHFDIGFALLPDHFGKGYAYEATSAVLDEVSKDSTHREILATTLPENVHSIKLIERLGLRFNRKHSTESTELYIFSKKLA